MATHSSILAQRTPREPLLHRGAWGSIVHRVTKSWTRLKRFGMHIYKLKSKAVQASPLIPKSLHDIRIDKTHRKIIVQGTLTPCK